MRPAGVEAVVTVSENAALLNTANAEVSTRFGKGAGLDAPRARC
jgi:hypothetical protein